LDAKYLSPAHREYIYMNGGAVCQKEVKWLVVLSVCVLMCSVSERREVVGGVVDMRADVQCVRKK
jgi:hypothetical protein